MGTMREGQLPMTGIRRDGEKSLRRESLWRFSSRSGTSFRKCSCCWLKIQKSGKAIAGLWSCSWTRQIVQIRLAFHSQSHHFLNLSFGYSSIPCCTQNFEVRTSTVVARYNQSWRNHGWPKEARAVGSAFASPHLNLF